MLKSNKKKIEIVGPLRMQEILKFKKKINQKKSNKILFLSFTPAYAGGNPLKLGNLGQYGKLNKDNIKFIDQMKFNNLEDRHYNYEQFYFAHKIFFECVKNNPKYKFEIRLKFNNEYNKQIINNLCKKICGYHPLNLKLDQSNLWESINESYFVSGYGSTGLLEASMLNKPSVQIINKNLLKNPKINSNLRISNHLKCFNIVRNKKDLDLIFNKFVIKIKKEKSKKNEVLNRKAKLAFKNFIFDFKNKNNQKFLKIIFNLIN